jgi:hypothetical protein
MYKTAADRPQQNCIRINIIVGKEIQAAIKLVTSLKAFRNDVSTAAFEVNDKARFYRGCNVTNWNS